MGCSSSKPSSSGGAASASNNKHASNGGNVKKPEAAKSTGGPAAAGANGTKKPAPGGGAPPESATGGSGNNSKPTGNQPYNRARDRIDAIPASKQVQCDRTKMRYAYLSQRGFYPDDPFKANQDAYVISEGLISTNNQSDIFFGVFDGHGKDGDGCAIFTKKTLPVNIKIQLDKQLKAKKQMSTPTGPGLTKEQIQTAMLRAHIETNKALHKNTQIDDSLSGTTAISVYFHGRRNRITICNVGDSRCVLGQETSSSRNAPPKPEGARSILKAQPLSRDQTPYRKDERARIKATGARVLSLDQLEGLEPIVEGASENEENDLELGEEIDEGGDPPRVWAPDGDYPGTAFTRSIGDAMAEDYGVFAEPEMLTRELSAQDKILVLASDGVYEFLTNQSVIDICAKFNDPLEACRAVVAEAYELWLQYELRTDDITIICIFLDEVGHYPERKSSIASVASSLSNSKESKDPLGAPPLGGEQDDTVDNSVLTTEGMRPVRKNVSKEMSKAIAELKQKAANSIDTAVPEDEFDLAKLATPKSEEEKRSISEAIKASVMFRNINDEQRDMILACMESVYVKAGEWVIRQNTFGDRFYIIDEGRFEVRILPAGEEDVTGQGGNTIHVYEGNRERHAHPSFGELALMYSAPRSASIVAQTDGHLWALHRSAFRQVLIQAQDHRKELKKVLGKIPYFQYLDSDGINKLAAIMDEITFGRGENIIEQGRPGEFMYVIASGTCYTVQMCPGETKRSTLKAGSFFGDEIFSSASEDKYGITVTSLQTTTCWQLSAKILKQTMGPLLQGDKKTGKK